MLSVCLWRAFECRLRRFFLTTLEASSTGLLKHPFTHQGMQIQDVGLSAAMFAPPPSAIPKTTGQISQIQTTAFDIIVGRRPITASQFHWTPCSRWRYKSGQRSKYYSFIAIQVHVLYWLLTLTRPNGSYIGTGRGGAIPSPFNP